MENDKLTLVFFIENNFQEKLLLLNPAAQDSLHLLAVYSQIQPQYFKGQTLLTEAASFELALPEILAAVGTEWLLYLKPEEKMPYIDRRQILPLPYYYLNILNLADKDEQQPETQGYEMRLFNKRLLLSPGFTPGDPENNCQDITIKNYSAGFPEIEQLKLNKYIKLYENGDKRLSVILYLARKNYLKADTLFKAIENLTAEESKSAEALSLYCETAKKLIEKSDFTEAKKILAKALLNFPASPAANFLLAEIFSKTVLFTQAISFYKKCIESKEKDNYYKFSPFPTSWIGYQAYLNMGKIYLELNDLSHARAAFENSLEEKHDFNDAKIQLELVEKEINKTTGKSRELDFACQSCGNCCRHKSINISHTDLMRILENRPDLKIEDIIQYSPLNPDVSSTGLFAGEFFTSENNQKKWMLLKKKPEENECVFLTEDNRCSIHAFKPIICKAWPFSLRKTDNNIVWAKNNRKFIQQYCAHKLEKDSNNPRELEKTLEELSRDRIEYISLVYKWNNQLKISKEKLSDSDFVKFLFEKSKIEQNKKKKKIMSRVLRVLKQDSRIMLLESLPFASDYFPRIDEEDLVAGLYIDNDLLTNFIEPENLEKLKKKFKAKSYYYSPLPVETINFVFEDAFLTLYINSSDYLNYGIYKKSKILYNPLKLKIVKTGAEELFLNELKIIKLLFDMSLDEVNTAMKRRNYLKSSSLLRKSISDLLSSMISWSNKKEFNFLEIPWLRNKTDDLQDFIINLSDFKYDPKSQTAFINELTGIFERNWQLSVSEPAILS
jgi:Fe-S-cluster containining protein/predicted negative regulator of RcsB-dependent stress response